MTGERIDKWLWHARFRRTRSLAARLCTDGSVRLNGEVVARPSQPVHVGDVLTFPQGRAIRVVRVAALATRRGPAAEAETLYEDDSPDFRGRTEASPVARERGSGRPTGKDRRELEKFLKPEAGDT